MQGMQVQSLVGELRCHKLYCAVKKFKKKKKKEEREREERAWSTTSESDGETLHTVCTDPSSALGTPVC